MSVIIILAAYIYFLKITTLGIWGADNFEYWGWGYRWAHGEYGLFGFYRPVVSLLYSLAFKTIGINDYSIKILNAILGINNILLSFLIASLISRSWHVGVAVSIVYVFSPSMIYIVKHEMVHTMSGFFLLLSTLAFILFYRLKNKPGSRYVSFQYGFLGLSGILLGIACHTHPEIAFVGPGFIAWMMFAAIMNWESIQTLMAWVKNAFIFTLSFFIPFGIGVYFFSLTKISQNLSSVHWIVSGPKFDIPFFEYFPIVFRNLVSFPFYNSEPISFLFKIAGIFMLMLKVFGSPNQRRQDEDGLLIFLPLLVVFSYLIGYTYFSFKLLSRLFIPFAAFVPMVIFHWFNKMIEFSRLKHVSIPLFSIAVLIGLTIWPPKPWTLFYPSSYKPSPYRQSYDLLKNKVNHQKRILVTPYTAFIWRKGFIGGYRGIDEDGAVNKLYFKKEYVDYISDFSSNLSLEEILKRNNIRYVIFSKRIHHKKNLHTLKAKLGLAYGFSTSEYSLEKEKKYLIDFFESTGAHRVLNEKDLIIYQLKEI